MSAPQQVGRCRSCGATILWTVTPNGRRLPLDPDPHPDGNVLVREEVRAGGIVRILRAHVLRDHELPASQPARRSHFATCPNANYHRRRR